MKKYFKLMSILVICSLIFGCSFNKTTDEVYKANGISITMNKGFVKKDLASATVYYESNEAILTALKETFTDLETANLGKASSVNDYAKAVLTNNKNDSEIKTEDDLTYFTYEKEASGKDFYYLASVYKSNDSFWLLNFACETKNKDTYEPLFKLWAKSVILF